METSNLLVVVGERLNMLRLGEAGCEHLLDNGLFGDDAASRPWPEHDLSLVKDFKHEIERDCVILLSLLIEWALKEPKEPRFTFVIRQQPMTHYEGGKFYVVVYEYGSSYVTTGRCKPTKEEALADVREEFLNVEVIDRA